MDERTCSNYRPGKRTAEGLVCCGGFHHWKDLEARVVGWSWEWLCPGCGGRVKKDPWNPPKDMPKTVALTSGNASNGTIGANQGNLTAYRLGGVRTSLGHGRTRAR